ncbi:zinc finger protein [Sesbania bispinosa]|nr:zinc finger protein [Sesbania bispinosa]
MAHWESERFLIPHTERERGIQDRKRTGGGSVIDKKFNKKQKRRLQGSKDGQ